MDAIGGRPCRGLRRLLGSIGRLFPDERFAERAGEAIGMSADARSRAQESSPAPETIRETSIVDKRSGANR